MASEKRYGSMDEIFHGAILFANVDDDGHPVSYYVKETAVSDLSAYDDYTTFKKKVSGTVNKL